MNTNNNNQERKQKLIWGIISVIIILLAIFFLQNNNNTAAISISPVGHEANVYINRTNMDPELSTTSPSTYEVTSGLQQIIVAHDGYWPWSQEVEVKPGETVQINPFLIEQSSQQVIQTTTEIEEELKNARLKDTPRAENPIISDNDSIRVFVDGDTNIIAQWNQGTSTAPNFFNCYEGTCGVSVFNKLPVQQIEFYPGRDDVIFFATPTGVFAMEIDPSGETQNFQPIAESVRNPSFTIKDGSIYVSYGDRIILSDI